MKKDEKITILIENERNKDELIYNNVVRNLNLSNHDEIKYLKEKVFTLEDEMKTRMMYTLVFLFAFVTLCFGVILLAFDLYLLGCILIFATFIFVIIKLLLHFRSILKKNASTDFEKIDELKKLLEDKLK